MVINDDFGNIEKLFCSEKCCRLQSQQIVAASEESMEGKI